LGLGVRSLGLDFTYLLLCTFSSTNVWCVNMKCEPSLGLLNYIELYRRLRLRLGVGFGVVSDSVEIMVGSPHSRVRRLGVKVLPSSRTLDTAEISSAPNP
jgi:hypothetical protein